MAGWFHHADGGTRLSALGRRENCRRNVLLQPGPACATEVDAESLGQRPVVAAHFRTDDGAMCFFASGDHATSNNPAAPIPPPMHIVTTTRLAPRRLPSMRAWPVMRAPLM